jgi:hypothetical protein
MCVVPMHHADKQDRTLEACSAEAAMQKVRFFGAKTSNQPAG